MIPSTDPPPFDAAWLTTVFLVPRPPRPWPARFAIVTAHDPGGAPADAEANRRFERELDGHLASRGLGSFEVTGASPDGSHRERGRGLAVSLDEAAAIARRFRQVGFFWVEDGTVFAAVDGSGRGWVVGRWDERLSTSP